MIHKISDIIAAVNSDKPLSIIRMGNVEGTQMLSEGIYKQMITNSGFFGGVHDIIKWKSMFFKALRNADLNLRVYTCNSFLVCDMVEIYFL